MQFIEDENDEENDDLFLDNLIVGQPIHEQVERIHDFNEDDDDGEYIRNDIRDCIWVDYESTKKRKRKRKCVQ